MPVYLFTWHAYGSWMPDHRRGYTVRGEGYQPANVTVASRYADRMIRERCGLDSEVSRLLIEALLESCAVIGVRLHAAVGQSTHLHALVSWKHVRGWMSVRKSLRTSMTKRLIREKSGFRFSQGASRKRVVQQAHFRYLMERYLPDHRGVAWYEDRGWTSAPHRSRSK